MKDYITSLKKGLKSKCVKHVHTFHVHGLTSVSRVSDKHTTPQRQFCC